MMCWKKHRTFKKKNIKTLQILSSYQLLLYVGIKKSHDE